MELNLPIYPITVMLVLIRFAALVGMTALFGRNLVPVRIRLMIAVALSWFAVMHLPPEWAAHCEGIGTGTALTLAVVGELMLGVCIGLVCDMFFAIFNMTGHVLARESSLAMAQMMDPSSGQQDTIISSLFMILLTVLVMLWNGHLYFVKLMMGSFKVLPPGFFWFRNELLEMYTLLGGDIFEWGVRFALPAIAGGMLVGVVMGLMGKMAPEFNVLFLSLPIRLGVGLSVLSIFLLYGRDPLYRIFETMLMHAKYLLGGG